MIAEARASITFTVVVSPLHACVRVSGGGWLCRAALQGTTLRRRRFAPDTPTATPPDVFNR